VSKYVAYQKYMHIKVCLTRGYIIKRLEAGQNDVYNCTWKINYTQVMAYCPTSVQSFMQKKMQKLVTRNIMDETMGHVPYIYNNLHINQ